MGEIVPDDYYESLALQTARDGLEAAHRDLAADLLLNGADPSDVAGWEGRRGGRVAATVDQVERILADRNPSMAKAAVAASLLGELARS